MQRHSLHMTSNSVPTFSRRLTSRPFLCSAQFCSKFLLALYTAFLQDEQSRSRFSQSFCMILAFYYLNFSLCTRLFPSAKSLYRNCLRILSSFNMAPHPKIITDTEVPETLDYNGRVIVFENISVIYIYLPQNTQYIAEILLVEL